MWRMSEGIEFHCFGAQLEKEPLPKVLLSVRRCEKPVSMEKNEAAWKECIQ